jgi:ribonucleoside-diphosphate reductase alpha chain
MAPLYRHALKESIMKGVSEGTLHESLLTFDLDYLATQLVLERDHYIDYMGLKTLNERYFLKNEQKRFEMPQHFWMRIAIGLARNEKNKDERAVEFYNAISTLNYVPSTPTLMHAGLVHSQLSSCYLNTISDDLAHIFNALAIMRSFQNGRAASALIGRIFAPQAPTSKASKQTAKA